jgi:hypothetical protein
MKGGYGVSETHTLNHGSGFGFRQLVAINVDATLLNLRKVRLDQTFMKVLEE